MVIFADGQPDEVRAAILDGAARLLDLAPPGEQARPDREPVVEASAQRRGRPGAMTPEMLESARLLRHSGRSVQEIAAELGVSRATLYRRLAAEG